MKRIMTLILAAGLVFGSATSSNAIDFNAKGEWIFGLNMAQMDLVGKRNGKRSNADDKFNAGQRIRMQIDAVASEALSGTIYFEIGDTMWGKASNGAALGADGTIIEVKQAYLDWSVPDSALRFRMGIQNLMLPGVLGWAVLGADVAGITTSYVFNDNLSLTGFWGRPINDNYPGGSNDPTSPYYSKHANGWQTNYLDNIDLFGLVLGAKYDGIQVNPWIMYGMQGKNARFFENGGIYGNGISIKQGRPQQTLTSRYPGLNASGYGGTNKVYGSMFWAGLPVQLSLWDPINLEIEVNYGAVEAMGRYDVYPRGSHAVGDVKRASTQRQGWLVKMLAEYKMDWGTPGLIFWYGSGDDGNVKNGSERMPSITPWHNVGNFLGGAGSDWAANDPYERSLSLDGTWGVALQVRDFSIWEDLKHTLRVAYWNGTNSPSMVKYMKDRTAWNLYSYDEGYYLTSNDALVEISMENAYKIYDNLTAHLELAYVINMIDSGTWQNGRDYLGGSFSKQDAWRAQVNFVYSF